MSSKTVQPIKIKVSTNINEKPFDLTISKIYDPAPGDRPRRILISDYPYFTTDVKYDEKFLASKSYSEIISIFFDKQEFVKVILKQGEVSTSATTSPNKLENANANIMTMLKLLFPTSYPTKNNLNTSYKKYLQKKGPVISFDISDVTTMFSSGEITPLGKRNYSYIKTEKGICTVSEVIWLNDVLNNSLYRELIDRLIEYHEWAHKQKGDIKEDIKKVSDKLLDGLKAKVPGSAPVSAPAPASGAGELLITTVDRDELSNQKRIYNPDDIKKDMMDIVKKYLQIHTDPAKSAKFDEELGYMLDYFIDTNLKNPKSTPITQLVRFKDKFDFTYTPPQQGTRDLFVLHKRYDGTDKAVTTTTLTGEKTAKETELDQLKNGYINNRKWHLGKQQIDQYLQNLKRLIFIAQNKKVNNGKQPAPTPIEIANTLPSKITLPPQADYDFITISPTLEYTKAEFAKFTGKASALNKLFIDEVTNRINMIPPADLTAMEEKIQKLTAEIAKIDSQIGELSKPLEEVFVFKDETDVPKEPISQIKKDNASDITKMQEEIFKSVITRYNRFQDIRRSAELSGQYTEIDTAIDVILDELIKLDSAISAATPPTPDQILSITEPIKNSFDKLVAANKISISRKIGTKLSQIIKLSNQIKFLTQLEIIFFKEPATGIFVEYEKGLDQNDSFTKLLISELKQEKYSNLQKMISFIKEKFLKYDVVSLNSQLSKLMKDYFENQSNGFYEQVVEPANKLINSGENPDFVSLEKIWDVSVTSVKSATWGNEYEISVYMDVIEGELNAKNQSEIKCQYLDEELTKRFEELMDEGPGYGPGKNTQVFSIKKAKEERVKHKQELEKEIESALSNNSKQTRIPVAIPISRGGAKRHTKSFRMKKLNNTKKRLQL